jgi:hypothetical protein
MSTNEFLERISSLQAKRNFLAAATFTGLLLLPKRLTKYYRASGRQEVCYEQEAATPEQTTHRQAPTETWTEEKE